MAGGIDKEYLFRLAREKSEAGRSALAATVSDLFERRGDVLTDRERALMFDILHKVIHDVEMSVRRALGERLATLPDAPHDLIRVLANDRIEVAYPVLTQSEVLHDEDLIEVIRNRTLEHQLAIAIRQTVSEAVSDALVATGHENVIRTLLENQNAQISHGTLEFLVEESKRVDTFQEPILHRRDLEPELAKRMYFWVSAALRQHIVDNFPMDEAVVDDLLEQAAFDELKRTISQSGQPKATELARRLDHAGMVSPDILVSALRDGEVTLFLGMFCHLTGLRHTLAMRILFEPGGEGLAIACKAIGLDADTFSEIYNISRRSRPASPDTLRSETRKVMTLYEHMNRESADEVLRKWRRDADYLAAIRDLELGTKDDG